VLKILKNIMHYNSFRPSWMGMFRDPFYITRKGLFKEISSLAAMVSGRVLDIGCGSKPYADIFNCDEYIGLEIDTPENRSKSKADLFYAGKSIPAKDSSFDWVVSFEVLEHVFNPDEFLAEVYRVIKPSGGLIMTVPFVWDEHMQPYDYARYSSFGLKFMIEKHLFHVMEHRKSIDDIRVIFQLINGYIFKILPAKNPYINVMFYFLFMSPFNILGSVLHKILPRNSDLYLDNVILARKMVK